MTQLVINIEDQSILPLLKKVIKAFDGVSIVSTKQQKKKTGIEEALEDIEAGNVYEAKDVDDLFKSILGV